MADATTTLDRPTVATPVYVLLHKDATGTVFLEACENFYLPVFTSCEAASAFALDSLGGPYPVCGLPDPAAVRAFLASPPSRGSREAVARVILDPAGLAPAEVEVMTAGEFTQAVYRG